MRSATLVAIALLCAGCAASPPPRCPEGQQPFVSALIYFGTATPDGVVSTQAWNDFLRDQVTPRFPQGLTTWDANGQWLSKDGTLTREDSHVLNLVYHDDASNEKSIQTIVSEYKKQFRQEAVLRVTANSCIAF